MLFFLLINKKYTNKTEFSMDYLKKKIIKFIKRANYIKVSRVLYEYDR